MKALLAAEAEVDVVSLRPGRLRGMNLHEPAGKVRVTKTIQEAYVADYDGLFIPGGYINPDLLRQSSQTRDFVRSFAAARKPIATLCHGPWVLASAGILQGRTITSWPGIRDDVVNAGGIWLDQEVVRDDNFVTSRGPQDLAVFVPAIISLYMGAIAPEPVARVTVSAPPVDEPPSMILNAMKWIPRPSFRTALGIGAVTLGIASINWKGQCCRPSSSFK